MRLTIYWKEYMQKIRPYNTTRVGLIYMHSGKILNPRAILKMALFKMISHFVTTLHRPL